MPLGLLIQWNVHNVLSRSLGPDNSSKNLLLRVNDHGQEVLLSFSPKSAGIARVVGVHTTETLFGTACEMSTFNF